MNLMTFGHLQPSMSFLRTQESPTQPCITDNKKRDARFREHDMKLFAVLLAQKQVSPLQCVSSFYLKLLPIFRPDGALLALQEIVLYFVLLSKEVAFLRSLQK